VWDLHTHRVLKTWDYHKDSIHALAVADNFKRVITGSKDGEIFMIDLTRGPYTKIDTLPEGVISLAIDDGLNFYASTARGLYEYVRK
jgi:hypothetical protein